MEDRDFLAAVVADPDNDVPRLIFADWLDERGDPRGEFIRIQCELARVEPHDERREALERREADLLAKYKRKWTQDLKVAAVRSYQFSRGFIETATLNAKNHLEHGGELLDRVPTIRHLKINAVNKVLNEFLDCAWLEQVESLIFTGNRLGTRRTKKIAQCPHLGNLKRLDLSGNAIGPMGLRAVTESKCLPKLERLDLSSNDMLAPDGRHNVVPPEGLDAIARGPLWSQLTHVGLSGMNWGDPALRVFFENLPPTHWQHLDLSFNLFHRTGLETLLQSPAVESLVSLNLFGCEFSADCYAALASAPRLANLERLELGGFDTYWIPARVRPPDVDHVRALVNGPGLGQLRALKLHLVDNNPQDPAIVELARATGLGQLEELFLGCPMLHLAGAQALVDSPFIGQLRRLYFGTWQMSQSKAVEELLARELGERLVWSTPGYQRGTF